MVIMVMIIQTIPADSRAKCARFGKWVQTLNIEIHQFSKNKNQQSAAMITISVKIISMSTTCMVWLESESDCERERLLDRELSNEIEPRTGSGWRNIFYKCFFAAKTKFYHAMLIPGSWEVSLEPVEDLPGQNSTVVVPELDHCSHNKVGNRTYRHAENPNRFVRLGKNSLSFSTIRRTPETNWWSTFLRIVLNTQAIFCTWMRGSLGMVLFDRPSSREME